MKKLLLILLLSFPVFGSGIGGGLFGPTRTVQNGTSDPATCQPTSGNVFINRNSTPVLKICTAADTWGLVGAGDVTGPASSTDNAVVRYDGTTGKLLQNSLVTVSDTGLVTLPAGLTVRFGGSGEIGFKDSVGPNWQDFTGAGFKLTHNIQALTADRIANWPNAAITVARSDAAQTFTGAQTFSGQILAADGTAASPSHSFSGQTDMGFYKVNSTSLSLGISGTQRAIYGTDGAGSYIALGPGHVYLGAAVSNTTAGIAYVAAGVTGLVDSAGADGKGTSRGSYVETFVGGNVASAATIAPTSGLFHVTGTTQITTISLPRASFTGCIDIIPDGLFTTATGGNIALASVAIVQRVITFCYDGTSWYPSY